MKYSYKKSACIGQFISVFYIGFEFKNNNTEKKQRNSLEPKRLPYRLVLRRVSRARRLRRADILLYLTACRRASRPTRTI